MLRARSCYRCSWCSGNPCPPRPHRSPQDELAAPSIPRRSVKTVGQRSIDDSRASQIQAALVKSGYLTVPSGHWDSDTSAAMQKFQADNGWQTKLVPDSRAIIKLGLGPDHEAARATLASGTTESASAVHPFVCPVEESFVTRKRGLDEPSFSCLLKPFQTS